MTKRDQISKVKYSSLTSMYLSANGFYKNYKTLKSREAEQIGIPQYEDLLSVAATSGFFAVEVYLKWMYAIVYWENNETNPNSSEEFTQFPKGHDIKELYEGLDEKSKKLIKEKLLDIMTEEQLLTELDNYRNGYMEWRYIFEKDYLKGNFDFLSKFLKVLYEVCRYYIDSSCRPILECQECTPQTSIIMHQETFNSREEAKEALNRSLKDVVKNEE